MKSFGPAYIICDRGFLEDKMETYSRHGWEKPQWIAAGEVLLGMHFNLMLYEDRPANWRHYRITKVGNPRKFVLGLHYGDGKPPIAVHGCDAVVKRGLLTLSDGLQKVSKAFAIDMSRLDYAEIVG